jgi:hypothetical protein
VGVITEMNTAADPPQIIIDIGSGVLMLVTLPGASRVSDLQIGASVTATGTLANNNLIATSFTVLSRPLGDDDDDDDDDDSDDDDNNENFDDDDDGDDNNENSDGDDDDDDGDDDDDDE